MRYWAVLNAVMIWNISMVNYVLMIDGSVLIGNVQLVESIFQGG